MDLIRGFISAIIIFIAYFIGIGIGKLIKHFRKRKDEDEF